jgi:hypothetical protein
MLSYPGLSGSPVFDIEGRVIGINRGSALFLHNIASYAYAIQSPEIIECLGKNHIEIELS